MSGTEVVTGLCAVVGQPHVLTQAADVAPYCTDWRGRYSGTPLCVVRPASTDEAARVVRFCTAHGLAMVPQGGNSGLCGGATPIGGEVLIQLGRLNRVRQVDAVNNTITAEAGCLLHAVQEAAAEVGRLFPLSLASEGSATIGGNLSTNAGGVQVLRYGNTRDLALGLEVVLPNGEIWNGLRALRKDNTGYDLKHLFIGAEGTLGLITAATLKLYARPQAVATAWVAVDSPAAAVSLLGRLRDEFGDAVTAFELVSSVALDLVVIHIPGARQPLEQNAPWQVLIEMAGPRVLVDQVPAFLEREFEAQGIGHAVIAASQAQARELWSLRENISEAQKRDGISIKHDVSLPISCIAEFVDRAREALLSAFPEMRIVCFGHVGDGNLHYNLSCAHPLRNDEFIRNTPLVNQMVHDLVGSLGGSISAEHGLGQLKRDEILRYKTATEMNLMRVLKASIDPGNLMNPGKVIVVK